MTNYKKYLEVIDFFDIKEDGRIFKKERHIKQNGGIQINIVKQNNMKFIMDIYKFNYV